MIYLWDTDTFSWSQRNPDGLGAQIRRLRPGDSIAVSAVTSYEALRGRINAVGQALTERMQVFALAALAETAGALADWPLLPYTADAAARFAELRAGRGNRGSYDLRLAAIALANGAVLVTRNAAHFAGIPGLTVENWIAPPNRGSEGASSAAR